MNITYRWLTEADIPELREFAYRVWHAHYPSIITREQIDFMLAKKYAQQNMIDQMEDGERFLLAIADYKMIGFLSVSPLKVIRDEVLRGKRTGPGDYFVHKFYVAPELHGKGIGKSLFDELHKRMPKIDYLRLQVARKNVNSWNFYKKRGFTIEREHDFDIGNGFIMADYVMEWRA